MQKILIMAACSGILVVTLFASFYVHGESGLSPVKQTVSDKQDTKGICSVQSTEVLFGTEPDFMGVLKLFGEASFSK